VVIDSALLVGAFLVSNYTKKFFEDEVKNFRKTIAYLLIVLNVALSVTQPPATLILLAPLLLYFYNEILYLLGVLFAAILAPLLSTSDLMFIIALSTVILAGWLIDLRHLRKTN